MTSPPLELRQIVTHNTGWEAEDAVCTMNVTLDAVIVQTEAEGFRADTAHVVVLDDFVPAECCRQLLDHLTAPGFSGEAPPHDKWERAVRWLMNGCRRIKQTADGPGLPVSWGLRDDAMATLLNGGDLPCLYELHSRLQKLYPDYTIVHQPAFSGEGDEEEVEHAEEPAGGMSARASGGCGGEVPGSSGRSADGSDGGHVAAADAPGSVCEAFVANAAVHGDTFLWHVDGDPSDIPDGPWTEAFGRYRNRDMGRPLFVSALLYLNERWEADWAAETLFADSPTGTGVFVRPRRGRLVLMDQDVRHRINAPSTLAPQPRYSFVEKLVFLPTVRCTSRPSIARPDWGRPSALGSAANLQRVVASGGRGGGVGQKRAGPPAGGAAAGGGSESGARPLVSPPAQADAEQPAGGSSSGVPQQKMETTPEKRAAAAAAAAAGGGEAAFRARDKVPAGEGGGGGEDERQQQQHQGTKRQRGGSGGEAAVS